MVIWLLKINILFVQKRGLLNIISAISFMTRAGTNKTRQDKLQYLVIQMPDWQNHDSRVPNVTNILGTLA
ncbi:hypothetical protein C0J52_05311 [Blattella germanica]|nr:hypothetical protein C0J52_05311 [Blattella germanica]